MELAFIAIIITAAVLLLQIVSLVLIAGMRKSISELKEVRAPQTPPVVQPEKREGDFRRHERRPYHDARPRHQTPSPAPAPAPSSGPVDPVEKSLRDINLRLKNAERDQEFARRKLQENIGRDPHQHNRDDRRGNRDHHRNRDNRRGGNWNDRQDRNRGAPQMQQTPPSVSTPVAPSQPSEMPVFERKVVAPPNEKVSIPQAPIITAPIAPKTPDIAPSDFGPEESLEHGRKFIVKRRPLKDEPLEPGSVADPIGNSSTAGAALAASNPEEETAVNAAANGEADIEFGRRKTV